MARSRVSSVTFRPVHRHVEVDPHGNALAGQILRQVIEGLELRSTGPGRRRAEAKGRSRRAHGTAVERTPFDFAQDERMLGGLHVSRAGHRRAVSIMRIEKPHSLSYQLTHADQLAFEHRGFEAVDGRARAACA